MIKSFNFFSRASYLCLFILFFSSSILLAQQNIGQPAITNFNYQDYDAGPSNWWVLEGDNGIMYFANDRGILEYDGVTWNLILLPDNLGVRSLAKGDDGTIYVSSEGDVGYLKASKKGKLVYVSLKDKLPEEHRQFTTVWDCENYRGKIHFRTTDKIFIWDGNSFEVKIPENPPHYAAQVNGEMYVRFWNLGLTKIENGEYKLVPGGEMFANERIYVMLPYDESRILIGTRTQGFFIYDGQTFEPFKTEIDDFIYESIYLPGEKLNNGNFVIPSFGNGAYVIDKDGKLVQSYIPSTGLRDGSVTYTYQDSRGILWLALFNGIARVEPNSKFTYIDTSNGLETSVVFDVNKFNDILYIGSNNGIYYLEEGESMVKRIPGTTGQAYQLEQIKGRLYTGTGFMGFMEIKDKGYEIIRESVNYDFRVQAIVQSTKDPDRIFIIVQGGLASFYYDEGIEQFMEESYTSTTLPGFVYIYEASNGDLLINSIEKGKLVVISPNMENGKMDLAKSKVGSYGSKEGLPNKFIFPQIFFGKPYFIVPDDKPYTFNEETKTFSQVGEFFDEVGDLTNSFFPRTDLNGKTFYTFGNGLEVVHKDGTGGYLVNSETFKELEKRTIFGVYPEKPKRGGLQVVWITGSDGIVRYEGILDAPEAKKFDILLRNIRLANDSLVYGGYGDRTQNLNLGHNNNTIIFEYAAPIYSGQNDVQYSTMLEGFEEKWSNWGKQTTREYINLPSGNYTFKTRARNLNGVATEELSVPFSIATPWYRTWWAYALYIIGFFALVYIIVRRRTKLLRVRQKELEDNVEARTIEVQKRLDELATINNVSKALTQKLELNALIKLVGDEMKRLFHSDITYLAILDEETNIINFPYQDGDTMMPLSYGEGLTSKIIRTGEPLLINRDSDIAAEYDKMGIKNVGKGAISYLGVPIKSEDDVIGVLSVQSTQQESRFNAEDKRLLSTIATNVGVAIHNAELFEEAKVAKAKAEDANEAKSAFLSTVSHELRTPLTSVLGFAKIIRKRLEEKIFPAVVVEDQKMKRTMKQVSENLNVVVSEGERLTTLINDVLDLAKIESGKMEWNKRPIFLQDAINRAISSTQSLIDSKNLKLEKKIPPDLPPVHADEDKLIQVVINLLSNAIKFTDKGKVRVEAYLEKGQIIVEIQDTGIGISEDDKHKVFERFRQAGDTLTDKPKGTGLGLPICREIIEHHGGIIWMTSEPGVGSTFFFSIPSLKEGNEQQPIQLDRILKSLKKQIKHSSDNAASHKKPTILVVDDDTPIRSLLRQELGDAGYNIKEAANGKAALDMVRLSKPDLIILDVMMPEINGFDVAAVLKNDPTTMDIPIIILSIVQDKERGMRIGVDRYLTKPINTEQLFHEVDVLLEQGVSNKKVLVVDTDSSAVKSLSDVLSARGYKVLETEPSKVYEMATESQPDIIMLNSLYNGDPEFIKNLKLQKGMENVMFFIYQ